MAGIGDGFTSGLELGSRIRDNGKRRKIEEARMAMDKEQFQKSQELQRTRDALQMDHDMKKLMAEQNWRSGEGDKDRGWRSGEREKDRGFRSTESAADRAIAKQNADTHQRASDAGVLFGGKKLAWEMDPENPHNKVLNSQSEYYSAGRQSPRETLEYDPEGNLVGRKVVQPMAGGPAAAPAAAETMNPGAKLAAKKNVPLSAIQYLRKNPQTAEQFKAFYGVDPEEYLK
jgi:hypothetical protein